MNPSKNTSILESVGGFRTIVTPVTRQDTISRNSVRHACAEPNRGQSIDKNNGLGIKVKYVHKVTLERIIIIFILNASRENTRVFKLPLKQEADTRDLVPCEIEVDAPHVERRPADKSGRRDVEPPHGAQ